MNWRRKALQLRQKNGAYIDHSRGCHYRHMSDVTELTIVSFMRRSDKAAAAAAAADN